MVIEAGQIAKEAAMDFLGYESSEVRLGTPGSARFIWKVQVHD